MERATAGRGEAQHSGAPLREGTFKLQRKESLCEAGGIVDVIEMANTMANRADRVAACKVPPALVSE